MMEEKTPLKSELEGKVSTQQQTKKTIGINAGSAFAFLKSLPRHTIPLTTDGPRDKAPSAIINKDIAKEFTDRFRIGADHIQVPICWSFDKEALLNLLGITSYDHYPEVNGVRFYAGVNESGLLTLVAVSTTTGTRSNCEDCRNDLTVDDEYPYYDYADPCPSNCSERGNLKGTSDDEKTHRFNRD